MLNWRLIEDNFGRYNLSPMERETARLFLAFSPNGRILRGVPRMIAEVAYVQLGTAEYHLYCIRQKLGVHTAADVYAALIEQPHYETFEEAA